MSINRSDYVMRIRENYLKKKAEGVTPTVTPTKPKHLYSTEASQLTPNQLSNIRANPKNPLTIMKPLRPNILDQMAVDNVNWLASQKRKAGSKWVPVQQF
jgi:hypothetical protein